MNPNDKINKSALRLTPQQAKMVDDLLAQGRRSDRPDELNDLPAEKFAELLQLIEAYPAQTAQQKCHAELVASTLARIGENQPVDVQFDEHADSRSIPAHLRFHPCQLESFSASARMIRFHWREAISAAALILLTVSVIIPMLGNARAQASRQACCSNLLGAGIGFSAYADDHQNKMPSIFDSIPEGNWLTTRANSANLFSLARANYVALETLACPWNLSAGVEPQLLQGTNWPDRWSASYAYQNQFGANQPLWNNPVGITAVLSDRNPLVDASSGEMPGVPLEQTGDFRSVCHDGDRQSILLSDGRVVRNNRPFVGTDNIWLPRNFTSDASTFIKYTGTEVPVDEFDSMLIQ